VLDEEKTAALEADFIAFHETARTNSGIVVHRPYVIAKATRVSESKRAS
jgi:hypothetical protein